MPSENIAVDVLFLASFAHEWAFLQVDLGSGEARTCAVLCQ